MNHQTKLPSSEHLPENFNRREIIVGLLASVGAMSTVSCAQRLETDIDRSVKKQTSTTHNLHFYSDTEFALVNRLSDLIIPATDTPGAIDVGVPSLMDQLYSQWASVDSQRSHRKAINQIYTKLSELADQDYLTAEGDKQLSALKALDDSAFSDRKSKSAGYHAVKKLIAKCYYATEPGATQELRYERVPGRWEACIPLEQVGRTWFEKY